MASETPAVDRSDAVRALRRANVTELDHQRGVTEPSVTSIGEGVNEVFAVALGESDGGESDGGERFVVKFGTFSEASHLRAGVAAYRLLAAYTDLPVPTVHAFEPDAGELPPFVVLEHLPGESLTEGFADIGTVPDLDSVRLLGAVVDALGRVPERAADGYGFVRGVEERDDEPRAVARYDDCSAWLVDYATGFYEDPPDHEALAAVAPRVPDYLRANRDRLPASPSPAVAVTDLSPENLLSRDGDPPERVEELTGVLDFERAKLCPVEFTAVNAEYLLTRGVSDPDPIRDALYDPLPFGPDVPARDLYRVIAMGRSVGALGFWYDPGSELYRERGEAIATELERIVG